MFNNIDNLHKDVITIVYTMFKTGLRISDVLGLKQDCLVKLNNKYWLETDIEKTYVEGHRIPIDNEIANMLGVLIDNFAVIQLMWNNFTYNVIILINNH